MRILLLVYLVLIVSLSQAQNLDTIIAVDIESSDYRFEASIETYSSSENWTLWTFPADNIIDSASIPWEGWGTVDYFVQDINDMDLATSWRRSINDSLNRIEFEFNYQESSTCYGSAYQFFGQINLFNGDCSSEIAWKESGRVKSLKVYFNDHPICLVILMDTWQFQYFSIERYFVNQYSKKNLSAPFEIKHGDRLIFELISTYEGESNELGTLSEFQFQRAEN